jgi:probable addiction module antidote protein
MVLQTTKWDVVDHLQTDEDVASFLEAAFEDGDLQLLVVALRDVVRAVGMDRLVAATGLSLGSLRESFGPEGKPEFTAVLKVMTAFGLRLAAVPLDDKAA